MSLNESFREKLDRERKTQEEKRRLKWEREEKEFRADCLRFKEEIETRGRPFFNTLLQSKIFDLVEELTKDKKDMKLGIELNFGFGKPEPWDYYSLYSLSSGVRINKDGKFEWAEKEFEMDYYPQRSNSTAIVLNRYRRTLALPEMMELKISLTWDYRVSYYPEGGKGVNCDRIAPFKIEKRGGNFYIRIGESLLGPQDWSSPEKVQNVIIQEYLEADKF